MMNSFAVACLIVGIIFVVGFLHGVQRGWEWYGKWSGVLLLLEEGCLCGFIWSVIGLSPVFGFWGLYWLVTHLKWVN